MLLYLEKMVHEIVDSAPLLLVFNFNIASILITNSIGRDLCMW